MKINLTGAINEADVSRHAVAMTDRWYHAEIQEILAFSDKSVVMCFLLYDDEDRKYCTFADIINWSPKGKLLHILRAITRMKLGASNFSETLDPQLLVYKKLSFKFRHNSRGFPAIFLSAPVKIDHVFDRSMYIRPHWVDSARMQEELGDINENVKIQDLLRVGSESHNHKEIMEIQTSPQSENINSDAATSASIPEPGLDLDILLSEYNSEAKTGTK